jgi:hypothetical protein
VSALLVTLAGFAAILLLVRVGVPLALAIAAGAVLLGLGAGMPLAAVGREAALGALRPLALAVLLAVVLLLTISELMQRSGRMEEIVALAGASLRRPTLTVAALPALIGLLPMPGGALFSAPLVASAAGRANASGELLSAINYWYRHVWEYWFPLYPGVILAMTLTGSSLPAFVAFQLPMSIVMAAAGLPLLRRVAPLLPAPDAAAAPPPAGRLARATASIWIVLLVWAPVSAALRLGGLGHGGTPLADTAVRFLPIVAGLLASLAWSAAVQRLAAPTVVALTARRLVSPLAGLVVSVMVFQHLLERSGLPPRIAAEMTALRLPAVLVVVLLPFIAGLVTGVAFGFVGGSFPIVVGLVAALPAAPALRPFAVLAYACGHLGMMASPIHLCYVVSNRFFGTPFGPVYRHLRLPVLLTAVGAAAYFLVLRTAMP